MVKAVTQFANDRYEVGRLLASYRAFFKADLTWTKVCKAVAAAMQVTDRTIRRIIEDYERANIVSGLERTAAEKKGHRLEAKKHAALVERLVQLHRTEGPPRNEDEASKRVEQALEMLAKPKATSGRVELSPLSPHQKSVFDLYHGMLPLVQGVPRHELQKRLQETLGYVLRACSISDRIQVTPAAEIPSWVMTGTAGVQERKAA